MEKICGIYTITNPKGCVYIGQSIDIRRRFEVYEVLRCKSQPRLYNSFKKYGVDKHLFEILCQCKQEELNQLERYYIEVFQCFNSAHGLNLTSGGNNGLHSEETKRKISEAIKGENHYLFGTKGKGHPMFGRHHSEEAKRKMSEAKKGKKQTEEHKQKLSEVRKGRKCKPFTEDHLRRMSESQKGEKSAWFGKTHTDETKRKMSEAQSGEKNGMYGKVLSEESRRKISAALRENPPFYGKHHTEEAKSKMGCNKKTVLEYDLNGGLVREWRSVTEASIYHNLTIAAVSDAIKRNSRTRKGVIFKFKE